jgi:Gas vesicle protein
VALDPNRDRPQLYGDRLHPQAAPSNLADILERVLDKGIVIAGDIQLNLLDIELITLKIRLLIASVDRAREMGINWWESDPTLTVPHEEKVQFRAEFEHDDDRAELEARIDRLERLLESGNGDGGKAETAKRETTTTRRTGGATPTRATRPASARRATGSRGGNAQKR